MHESSMTRRSFAKATAVAGAAIALSTITTGSLQKTDRAWAASGPERRMVKTLCHGCIAACPVRAYTEDGVVVKLEGDPDGPMSKGSFCTKGLNQIHTCYSPRRVLYPLKRVGARGVENVAWERISWDEAIDLAATTIKNCIDKYGPNGFFTAVGGGGSYSFMTALTFAMYLGSSTCFEPGCAQCWLPRQALSVYVYGMIGLSLADGAVQEPFNEWNPQTECLVLWGAQPSVSQTAQTGRGMADLRNRGAKTIVIDPYYSPDAVKATVWLPVRAGTDGALLLSWFRYIIENKLYDEHFAQYWTNYPFLINPDTRLPWEASEVWPDYVSPTPTNTPVYVCYDRRTESIQPLPFSLPENSPVDPELLCEVEVNGKMSKSALQVYADEAEPWTLEHTAEVCWLQPEKIEQAIRMYAVESKIAGIGNGVASDQMPISSQVPLGCLGLDCLMGYVNKPGAALTKRGIFTMMGTTRPVSVYNATGGNGAFANGIGWVIGQSEEENRTRFEAFEDKARQEAYREILLNRLGCDEHKGLYNWSMVHIPTVLEAIKTGVPFKPRVWYDFSGNKLNALANAESWFEVFNQIDFIINQFPNMTSFQVEAVDLMLPVVEWLEFSECSFMTAQLNATFPRTAVVHLGESVENSVVPTVILKRIGELQGGIEYPPLEDGAASHQAICDGIYPQFDASSYDDLLARQDELIPKVTPPEQYWLYNQHEHLVDDGLPEGFATMSRKMEPYCQILIRMSRDGFPYLWPYTTKASSHDYSPICQHIEPAESPFDQAEGYDPEYPLVITSGRLHYFHHGTMRHSAFTRELYPVPEVRIHPTTAENYGIQHMDWVKLTSRRSSTHARAYVTVGMAPNALWMERFWNPECFDDSQEIKTGGWRECNINVLTKNSAPFNEVFGSYTNRGFTVKIEKAEKPAGVWVEPREFEPFMPTLQTAKQDEEWVI